MRSLTSCDRCGGDASTGTILTDGTLLCLPCAYPEPEPRHEVRRLFEPAPTQIPGQLSF